MLKLSVVIPAYNESASIEATIRSLYGALSAESIPHKILVVNDNSTDDTAAKLDGLKSSVPTLSHVKNEGSRGFGRAVTFGLDRFTGDCVAIMMADGSDSPNDLVKFYRAMESRGYDCVFGSRFIKGGSVAGYPRFKRILNRLTNALIRVLFGIRYNDCTNAFKLYKRETVHGLKPFLSPHFNLTVELPLKAIIRGYSYTVLPNSWQNRKHGASNLKIKEMGSRYFYIILYCWIEKYFSRGDFHKKAS